MKKFCTSIFSIFLLASCSSDDHVIGGEVNTLGVDVSTSEFFQTFEITEKTALLFEKAGMTDDINGEVTVIAPSDYAINRYLRRKNNRRLRVDPNSELWTVEDIPVAELEENMGMYIVDGIWWRETIPEEGIVLATHKAGDSVRLSLAESTDEPSMGWDGAGTPGWGYQYPNFMQTNPVKVFVQYKRGENWEMSYSERSRMSYDDPERDILYQMYISDVLTTNGATHVIYTPNEGYTDHYYYHTLFFFGTRADDQL